MRKKMKQKKLTNGFTCYRGFMYKTLIFNKRLWFKKYKKRDEM